jgi:hypothetical protein
MRVGIDISFSSVTSSSTNVDVTIKYYIENTQWFSDNQTLKYDSGNGSWQTHNFTNDFPAGVELIRTVTRSNLPISYSGGPTYTAKAEITGAYDGSNPSKNRNYTLPERPASIPGAPGGPYIQGVTNNSAQVYVTGAASNGATIDAYQIEIATNTGFTTGYQLAGNSNNVFGGLAAATTYYTRSRAHNAAGWGPYTGTKSFTTGATIPGAPTGVGNNSVLQTTANVTWTAPASNGGSAINSYQIQIATNSGFTTGVQLFEDPDDVSPYGLTGLNPATTYWARVRALNGVGAGAFSAATSFTTLTGTPVVIAPGPAEVSPRGWPYAIIEATGIQPTSTITVEFAKDIAFTVGLQTVTLAPGTASPNNRYTIEDTTKSLTNGTWYVRTRVTTTSIGYTTPDSPIITYTVSHTPAALLVSPATGTTAKYTASTNFSFAFSDPSTVDKMSAYQLVIEDNASAAVVFDSTKTALAGTSNIQSFVIPVALPDTVKAQVLRWRVRVWDRDDQPSVYTGYSTLTLVDPPLVSIVTPPNASTVETGSPTLSWTFSAPSGGTQASALVEVRDSSTNSLVWSRNIVGAATTVTPSVVILSNGNSYTLSVTAKDTYGLTTVASSSFDAVYSAPEAIIYNFDSQYADEYGYVDVAWVEAEADSLFVAWKVYRRASSDSTGEWVLVYETSDQNVRHYFDYMLTPGDTYSYSVTQAAFRSGSVLESPVGYYLDDLANEIEEDRFVEPDISHYWIIDPENNQNSVRLESVTADSNTLEFETDTYNIIGRGRHRDYGDELGYTGSITCQVRGTERRSVFRQKMETLRRNQGTYYLRTPFGQLFPVALGDIGWAPIPGTGIAEMGDMTIPYEQVS